MKYLPVLLIMTAFAAAQNPYPKDYFRSPLDIPLHLSGNFGELRNNHFHAGFDFRTQQKEGLNVYASAEGYVSRIKISAYGYGKALYITHPNGYSTVYGHLKRMAPTIEKYLKDKHYELQSFDLDINIPPGDLPVTKGQLIAYSGNTGGSGGPHLHWEIRDSQTENIINPMHFGFDKIIPDSKPPTLTSLMVYPLDATSAVNQALTPIILSVKQESPGNYIAENVYASGRIGFAINASDRDDHSHSANGLFQVQSYFNGGPVFGYKFDTFHFDETRYINALIDYPRYKRTSQRFQKLYYKKPYPLNIVKADVSGGIISVTPNVSGSFRIELGDFHGNKINVTIPIFYSAPPTFVQENTTGYFLDSSKDNIYEKDNVSVTFPAGTFYEDFYLDFDAKDRVLLMGNKFVPVHKPFTVSIKEDPANTAPISQLFIAEFDGARKSYNATTYKDGVFTAKVKTVGNYMLARDSTPPTITPVKNITGKWISSDKVLQFTIKDDLSGIKSIDGWLNGKWILFEYDYKTRKIVHDFSDNIYVHGRNELKVEVKDNVGNSAIFETHFFKSAQ